MKQLVTAQPATFSSAYSTLPRKVLSSEQISDARAVVLNRALFRGSESGLVGLDPRLLRFFRRYAIAATTAAAAFATLALFGLLVTVPFLASLTAASTAMKANTGAGLVVSAIGVAAVIVMRRDRPFRASIIRFAAILIMALGILTTAEYVFGFDFGIDQLLLVDSTSEPFSPGRMAIVTAINFTLLGAALLTHVTFGAGRISLALTALALFPPIVTFCAYFLQAQELYTLGGHYLAMAVPTALAFLLLASALLLSGEDSIAIGLVASPRPGGIMFRRLLPVTVCMPLLIVWLRQQAQAAGLFNSNQLGASAVAIATMVLLSSSFIWAASKLDRADAARQSAEGMRAAAQYARSLLEASLDPLLTISPEGKITDVNEATVNVTGLPRDKLVGSDFAAAFSEPEKARAGYQKVLSAGSVIDYPLAIRHISGRLTEVLYNASLFHDQAGAVAGVFAAARDITARKHAEAELLTYHQQLEQLVEQRTAALTKSNSDLEAANKELEAFSYSVSHDLRSPLRAIDGFSQVLVEDYGDKLDDEGRRVIDVVRDGAQKMGQLIDDILAFSRIGRVELASLPIDMDDLAHSALQDLKPVTANRNLKIDFKPLPAASGDPTMLRRVWTNLLENAIKFTNRQDSAIVEVGARAGEKENVYYVKDNGVGFDMQYVEKLFGVFQRLHPADQFPGTGIGLAIVKRIVNRHGGRVWAEGRPGEGATFYFTLPVKDKNDG